jgi:hypothetical protein
MRKFKVVINPYDALPCACAVFTINGIDADSDDFGNSQDTNPAIAEPYGCGNSQFMPKLPTDKVLKKYKINLAQYAEICDKLQTALNVGACGWCV